MTNLNTNLTNNFDDAFSKVDIATHIIQEREQSKKFDRLAQSQKICAILFALIHQGIESLRDDIELMQTIFVSDNVIQHLRNLRALFRALTTENLSQSLDFALKLSKSWNGILNYHQLATSKEMRKQAYINISKLIDFFNRYPTADEHALGYYLCHYAGEDWLPFPFMAILNDLYEEHLQASYPSNLDKLVRALSRIIESFSFFEK